MQIKQLQQKVNELVETVKNWPQYRKIAAVLMATGILLILIGILIY